jgi:hypothetical protein
LAKAKYKAGVFNILVNGKYVGKVCAVNQAGAVEKYKREHQTETGNVTAKWHCPAPIQGDCDEYIEKLSQIEKMKENTGA